MEMNKCCPYHPNCVIREESMSWDIDGSNMWWCSAGQHYIGNNEYDREMEIEKIKQKFLRRQNAND